MADRQPSLFSPAALPTEVVRYVSLTIETRAPQGVLGSGFRTRNWKVRSIASPGAQEPERWAWTDEHGRRWVCHRAEAP